MNIMVLTHIVSIDVLANTVLCEIYIDGKVTKSIKAECPNKIKTFHQAASVMYAWADNLATPELLGEK